MGVSGPDGRVVFSDLPAGTFTITEIAPPSGYLLGENNVWEVTVGWGQTGVSAPSHTFFNIPKSYLEIIKIDAVTGEPLIGAVFELSDPTTGETWQATTVFEEREGRTVAVAIIGRGEYGNFLYPNRTYILREIIAPPGYMLNNIPREIVLSPGGRNSITIENTPYTYLEVLKIDANTNRPLQGAIFVLRDPLTGEEWRSEATNSNGIATIGQNESNMGNFLIPDRNYILVEIVSPNGYILNSSPRTVVLTNRGRNEIVIQNYHNPSLTILKRDRDTQAPLEGAVFEIEFENGQPIPDSPFTTGADGRVTIPNILGDNETERTVIVTEIIPPQGYNLDDPNERRVVIRAGEDNVITFENTRQPYLEIIKTDSVLGTPIPGAWFEIEYLGATGGGGQNIGPTGPLTGNPFITDSEGKIRIPNNYSGRFLIREIRSANGYWLDPLEQNRTWIIEIRDNEDYTLTVENTLLPTLVIRKMNALTFMPVPLTQFRVEFEVPNSPNVQHIGYFITDNDGYIILPFVEFGWYRITETRPAPGMALNINNSYRVFLQPGQNTYLYLERIRQRVSIEDFPTIFEIEEIEIDLPEIDYEEELIEDGDIAVPNIPAPNEDIPIVDIESDNENSNSPQAVPEDLENIELVNNAELVNQITANISVTGGGSWQNEQGVWNWPRATRFRTNTILQG